MKLSDEEISKYLKQKIYIMGVENTAMESMEFVRDFYENQKCETCGKNILDSKVLKDRFQCTYFQAYIKYAKDFGCTEWEPKQ